MQNPCSATDAHDYNQDSDWLPPEVSVVAVKKRAISCSAVITRLDGRCAVTIETTLLVGDNDAYIKQRSTSKKTMLCGERGDLCGVSYDCKCADP